MTPSRLEVHRSALPTLLLGLGLALACPNPAMATDTQLWGGPGGEYFRENCPPGAYLVGVDGRSGGWVDSIAPVCAPWLLAQQKFGAPTVGKPHGTSTGGMKKQVLCWGAGLNNLAVHKWTVWLVRTREGFVSSINALCASLTPPVVRGTWDFGPRPDPGTDRFLPQTSDLGRILPSSATCHDGELAVGIHGRAGLFVDAIGLICGPIPPRAGAPAAKVNPLATTPPMMQQAPLPNSSVMSPPAASPPPQMKRSPFLVRPRGVEGESDMPKEETSATETKP